MKVVFIYPDFDSLGIGYLMAGCLKNGHQAYFLHYKTGNVYMGETRSETDYSQIAGEAYALQPDVVAFSCVSDMFQSQLKCAQAVKKRNAEVITIFGGVHTTAVPEIVLQNDAVDCIAIGEADISFVDFLNACTKKNNIATLPEKAIKGIAFKRNGIYIGEFVEGPLSNLNDLPYPEMVAVPHVYNMNTEYKVMTSRGCPYSCSYCFNSQYRQLRCGKNLLRRRSVESVIEELQFAKGKYFTQCIAFVDDCFTSNTAYLKEFLTNYRDKVGLPFSCISNPNNITEEIADALNDSGCVSIQLGIQTFSEELSKQVLERNNNNVKIAEAISLLKKRKIFVTVDYILGIPGDTIKNQEDGIAMFNVLRPNRICVYWLVYYPKTNITNFAFQRGILDKEDLAKINNGFRLGRSTGTFMNGDLSNPAEFYPIAFFLNYLLLLPKFIVGFMLKTGIYRIFRTNNYFLTIAVPRALIAIFNKNDFHGRKYIKIIFNKLSKRISGHLQ